MMCSREYWGKDGWNPEEVLDALEQVDFKLIETRASLRRSERGKNWMIYTENGSVEK